MRNRLTINRTRVVRLLLVAISFVGCQRAGVPAQAGSHAVKTRSMLVKGRIFYDGDTTHLLADFKPTFFCEQEDGSLTRVVAEEMAATGRYQVRLRTGSRVGVELSLNSCRIQMSVHRLSTRRRDSVSVIDFGIPGPNSEIRVYPDGINHRCLVGWQPRFVAR